MWSTGPMRSSSHSPTSANSRPRSSAPTNAPMSPWSRSMPPACRRSRSGMWAGCGAASGGWRLVHRSVWRAPSLPASSAPSSATPGITCHSYRPMSRSTPATPAARSSTCAARWWASTARSIPARGASWAFRSRFRWTKRSVSAINCAPRAVSRAAVSAYRSAPSARMARGLSAWASRAAPWFRGWGAIEKVADLPRLVGATKPGSKSVVTVFRRGVTRDLGITIAAIEPDKATGKAAEREDNPKASAAAQQIGLSVTELSDAQKKELKLKGGVVVLAATDAAARAGLREDDIILSIANTEISGVKDFDAVLAKADKSKAINLLYRRGEWTQYALIRPAR